MDINERTVLLEGPDPFLDIVYETIEGHVQRTGNEYGQIITGVGRAEVGDVEHETESVLPVYVLASVDPEDALELLDLALDRIADEHDMDLARQGVRMEFEDAEVEE